MQILKSERQAKLDAWREERAKHERLKAERAQAIADARNDPDYLAMLRQQAAEKKLKGLTEQNWDLTRQEQGRINELEAAITEAADPAIPAYIDFLFDQRRQLANRIEVHGYSKKNFLGAQTGYVSTNKSKVDAAIAALDEAIVKTRALLLAPNDDATEALEAIRQSLPVVADLSPIDIEVSPHLANNMPGAMV
jgi:hypothetical protein